MVDVSGFLFVHNRGGKVVASCDDSCEVRFKAAYTGPYYVVALPADEDSGGYQVGLTVP